MDNQNDLRIIKNKIIGNPEAKDSLAVDPSLARVLQCLSSEYNIPTQIEAANVLYSLSSGSQVAISELLKHKTSASLLSAIGQLDAETPSRLKVALGRALRTFMCSLADCSGPQRWGILPSVEFHLRKEAQAALDDFLQPTSLDIWVPFLQDSSLYPFLCATVASSIRTTAHRVSLCDWLPPVERAKASKGKRGWEKRATSITSPTASSATPFSPIITPSQSWVLRYLLRAATTQGSTAAKIAVSLEALAALCKDNPSACAFLRLDSSVGSSVPVASGGETISSATSYLQSLLLLQRSSNPEVSIATNELLANVAKTTLSTSLFTTTQVAGLQQYHRSASITSHPTFSMCLTILHNLIAVIGSNVETEEMRARISLTNDTRICLASLVADDKDIAEAAVDCGIVPAVLTALEWSAKPSVPKDSTMLNSEKETAMDVDLEPEEEESQAKLELREAAFTVLATVGLTNIEFSRQILKRDAIPEKSTISSLIVPLTPTTSSDTLRPLIFPLLSQAIRHPNLGVRYSALQLIRAFSRALATLRTSLVDSDIPAGVIEIVKRESRAPDSMEKVDATGPMDPSGDLPEPEHRAIVIAALMVLCNLLNDYAPFRENIIKGGAVKHLALKTHSLDDELRLNAVWALRNATFNAKTSEITTIMETLTWDHFLELTNDPDRRVREQAIILLQNITTGTQEISFTVKGLGTERLVNLLQAAMSQTDSETVEHATRAMNNIVTESPRDLLASNKTILTLLKNNLSHSSVAVRHASAICICEMLARYPFRHRELREVGIEQSLRAVIGGRDRVAHVHTPTMSTGSSFGAALNSVGPFSATTGLPAGSSVGGSARFPSPALGDAPGLMGKESDREVLDAVKLALALLEKGKE